VQASRPTRVVNNSLQHLQSLPAATAAALAAFAINAAATAATAAIAAVDMLSLCRPMRSCWLLTPAGITGAATSTSWPSTPLCCWGLRDPRWVLIRVPPDCPDAPYKPWDASPIGCHRCSPMECLLLSELDVESSVGPLPPSAVVWKHVPHCSVPQSQHHCMRKCVCASVYV